MHDAYIGLHSENNDNWMMLFSERRPICASCMTISDGRTEQLITTVITGQKLTEWSLKLCMPLLLRFFNVFLQNQQLYIMLYVYVMFVVSERTV